MHSYADSMHGYLSFDRDFPVEMIKNKIREFLQDVENWMTCNFPKLNKDKAKVIEILSNRNVETRIISDLQN